MSSEDCDSVIFPSNGSMIRCRSLLRWVPWIGSPPSQLVCRTPTSGGPCQTSLVTRFGRSSPHRDWPSDSPKFLDCPCQRAVLSDPGGGGHAHAVRDASLLFGRFAVACRGLERVGP